MLSNRTYILFLVLALICLMIIIPRVEYLNLRLISVNSKPISQNPRCADGHIITLRVGGQLGNRIWQYMSLLAIYQLHKKEVNFDVFLPYAIRSPIELLFGRIRSFPIVNYIPQYCANTTTYILGNNKKFDITKLRSPKTILVLEKYATRYKDIVEYGVDKIRLELKFRDLYTNYCNRALNKIKQQYNMDHNVTFVGMHYRGTDYFQYLKKLYHMTPSVNATYYLKAMDYFKRNYQNVIFLLMTTDKQWLKVNLPILLPDNNLVVNYNHHGAIRDLVMMSMCNHSIISYGTYGSTGAFFAGGTTFIYNLRVPLDTRGASLALRLSKVLPKWHAL